MKLKIFLAGIVLFLGLGAKEASAFPFFQLHVRHCNALLQRAEDYFLLWEAYCANLGPDAPDVDQHYCDQIWFAYVNAWRTYVDTCGPGTFIVME